MSLESEYYTVCNAKMNFAEWEWRYMPTRRRAIYLAIAEEHFKNMSKK